MTKASESPLIESLRHWLLEHFSKEQCVPELMAHLETKDAHELSIIFLNQQSRLVPATPRKVLQSTSVKNNQLAAEQQGALEAIISDIEAGRSLKKYLSRSIKIATVLPSENPSSKHRPDLDLMLNAWGIHHLHLSTSVDNDVFVPRTRQLLFVVFNPDNAYLLDVKPHGCWNSKHFIEILVREFPESDTFNIVKGTIGLAQEYDDDDIANLRKKFINSMFMVDGKVVQPRPGMVSTGTTIQATREVDMLLKAIENFEHNWKSDVEEPELAFEMHETEGPGILERKSKTFYTLFQP